MDTNDSMASASATSSIVAAASDLSLKQKSRKAIRNARAPLSCFPCRTRKLKCDRKEPCQNCSVRGEANACLYATSQTSKSLTPPGASCASQAESMQQRINRLESLVRKLASQVENNEPSPDATNSPPSVHDEKERNHVTEIQHGVGVLQVSNGQSQYRGSTHWGDVFHELKELKNLWSQVQEVQNDQGNIHAWVASPNTITPGPTLLSGPVEPVAFEELLATLPEKHLLNIVLGTFFDPKDSPIPSFQILHKPTFMKQYDDHQKNPSRTPIMWLGLLFSILSLVTISYQLAELEPLEFQGITAMAEIYRLRTIQCIVMGDITRCAPYTLETLIFHAIVEQARSTNSGTGAWMLFGVLTRVALQMGYHRDPSHYPNISIPEGEMRRRIWYFIIRLDSLLSFTIGLTCTVRSTCYDTALPRNLHDWELHEKLTELPASRPNSEDTPVSYMLAKESLAKVLGDIVDLMSELKPYSYTRVLQLDDDLSDAQAKIPPQFQMKSLEDSANNPPSLVSRRIQLEILYHQGMCVLHRKFLAQNRIDGGFEPSRKRCIRSALAMLSLQDILYKQVQLLQQKKGTEHLYRFTFTDHEFVLAAMILCLELRHRKSAADSPESLRDGDDAQQQAMSSALQGAYHIWNEAQRRTSEARKVLRILSHMLESLGILPGDKLDKLPEEHLFSHPENTTQFAANENAFLQQEMEVDWAMWDSFIEGASFEDTYEFTITPSV
ncbi:fungal-specific transcription factor domain-containing protein [Halenospora varia]|nr:fungal-specific transcription factor domain-containing protein [Halenospora varia]